jgi:hypothetical protein
MTTPGTSSSRARVTVAGAGSRLIPCDSVGPRVLELCSGRFGEEVELFECGTTPLSLLDCIRGQELMAHSGCMHGRLPQRRGSNHGSGPDA